MLSNLIMMSGEASAPPVGQSGIFVRPISGSQVSKAGTGSYSNLQNAFDNDVASAANIQASGWNSKLKIRFLFDTPIPAGSVLRIKHGYTLTTSCYLNLDLYADVNFTRKVAIPSISGSPTPSPTIFEYKLLDTLYALDFGLSCLAVYGSYANDDIFDISVEL